MKIARWIADGKRSDGILVGGTLIELPGGMKVQDLLELGLGPSLEMGNELQSSSLARGVPVADVELLPPLHPPSVRDFVAFEEHVEGIGMRMDNAAVVAPEWYEFPTFYFSNPHSLIGSGAVVTPPAATEQLDFELEVGIVIGSVEGSLGNNLAPAEAQQHIFGYSIFNDWSARDIQAREMKVRLGPSKGKDFATTLGPWITTADEFDDRFDAAGFLDIQMSVWVNGEPIGTDTLANLGWPIRDLVAYASRDARIVPGDVLGTGTAGSGCLAELWGRNGSLTPPPLVEGDVVTMTVERVGTITNTVGAPRRDTPVIGPARARAGSPAAAARRAAS